MSRSPTPLTSRRQQVKQLEYELGSQLLVRTSHSVALTEAGRELLPYARKTLKDAEMCQARMDDINSMAVGTLNIGVTYSFGSILSDISPIVYRIKFKLSSNNIK